MRFVRQGRDTSNRSRRTLVLPACATAALLCGGISPALALEGDNTPDGEEFSSSGLPETPTVSTVTPVAVDLPPGYTDTSSNLSVITEVPEVEALAPESGETEDLAYVARVEVTSDINIVGASWDADSPPPTVVNLRTEENGFWTDWVELEIDSDSASTEPYATTNISAVEVVAYNDLGEALPGLSVVVIDPRAQGNLINSLEQAASQTSEAPDEEEQAPSDEVPEGTEPDTSPTDGTPVDPSPEEPSQSEDVLTDLEGAAEGTTAAAMSRTPLVIPTAVGTSPAGTYYDTGVGGLRIGLRSAWGGPRTGYNEGRITISGAVVHHTAGGNNYTKSQVPGIIKGIYHYHAETNNWGDLGYQLLVDKFGGVWEGRAGLLEPIQGAQAYGANKETFGISVLGTYSDTAPSAEAMDSLAKAIAWKLQYHGITTGTGTIRVPGDDSAGRTVPRISGHRDIGATECPGDAFYARLPALRQQVERYMTPAYSGTFGRLDGKTRYSTAASIAQSVFSTGARTVYLASGTNPVDAMVAGTVTDGPILLVRADQVPTETAQAIKRLNPSKVIAIGGTTSIPDSVLRSAAGTRATARLAGDNRIETAIAVSRHVFPNGANTAYVADSYGLDGFGSPDAVAGANSADGPILLSNKAGSPDPATAQEIQRLKAKNVYELGAASLGFSAKKLAGLDRYETAAAIASHAYPGTQKRVYLVRGDTLVDAATAGVITNGPRLLVNDGLVPPSTCDYLRKSKPTTIIAIGGTTSISQSMLNAAGVCAATR